ncbi:MAG: aldo/keto reductase [Mycobacteriales bacterium]
MGCSPAQIALAWTLHQPAVVTTLIGATSPEQLHANLDAATLTLPTVILQALDSASRLLAGSPYRLFSAAR